MTAKELKRLRRSDLLEMLLELSKENQALRQELAAEKTEDTASALVSTPPKMKAVPVNGHLCVGYLTIPKLTLELPVLAACTYGGKTRLVVYCDRQ